MSFKAFLRFFFYNILQLGALFFFDIIMQLSDIKFSSLKGQKYYKFYQLQNGGEYEIRQLII